MFLLNFDATSNYLAPKFASLSFEHRAEKTSCSFDLRRNMEPRHRRLIRLRYVLYSLTAWKSFRARKRKWYSFPTAHGVNSISVHNEPFRGELN